MSSGDEAFGMMFVGVGHPHSRSWWRAFEATPGVRMLGAYDPDEARLDAFLADVGGERRGLDDLGRDDVHAAVVDPRNDEVAGFAAEVLARGKPFMLEKPGGANAGEIQVIANEAAAKGLAVQLGYFLRYADSVAEVKRMLDDGELGTVSMARIHAAMPRQAWEGMGEWFADPKNIAGMFQEDACHIVDIGLLLFGQPRAVIAASSSGAFETTMREDALVAVFDYGTHLVTLDFTAQEANPWVENWSIEIYGTDATVRAGMRPEWVERYDEGGFWRPVGTPKPADREESQRLGRLADQEQYRTGAAGFVAAAKGEAAPLMDVQTGLRVFRMVEAIYQAADSGCRVTM